jgi:uncharacterized NAD(P)/FAD-binding protein YdhS
MKRITIIGGGASGTLLAANLLRASGDRLLEINMVEKNAAIGRGVAYSTPDDIHLLNVPAAKMSAFPDAPDHFLGWLEREGYQYGPTAFVPRKLFGEYLNSVIHEAQETKHERVRLNVFEDDAVDIHIEDAKAQVTLASGEYLYSESVVLAFGNFLPPQPTVRDLSFTSHPKYFRSPWHEGVFDSIAASDSVLIIGTGLSMVDVVLKLAHSEHKGKIQALSTRGLLPAVHKLGQNTYDSFADELRPMSRITDILKSVRRHIKKAETESTDWRAVIDSLRPVTQEIWLNLPVSEKRYFMQHLSRYWNVARHRMPAEAAAVLDTLQTSGRLEILKGRLQKITTNEQFHIEYRSNGTERRLDTDVIINCIGSESDFSKLDSKLVENLFSRGHIRSDALNFGIDALPNGSVVGQNGARSDVIYTLGTALKGTLWETTAIPEIRTQARQLAERLLAD